MVKYSKKNKELSSSHRNTSKAYNSRTKHQRKYRGGEVTPLINAIHLRKFDEVEDLINSGANVNELDKRGSPALIELIYQLINDDYIIDDNDTDTEKAEKAEKDRKDISDIKKLLELFYIKGANFNAVEKYGHTCLHVIVELDTNGVFKDIIRQLLFDYKVDPTIKTKYNNLDNIEGRTALNVAEENKNKEIIKFLVEYNFGDIYDGYIKYYIKFYYSNNKDRLPPFLRDKEIGSWDVSKVTDMKWIFHDCENFNEPLIGWNVSNVTDMSHMFSNCIDFNQPLDRWSVSQVIRMGYMFSHCTNFNQPLNNWDVSNVTDNIETMFLDCNISPINKPHDVRLITIPRVNPNQIHRESAKINYKKLNNILDSLGVQDDISISDFPVFLKETLTSMIDNVNTSEKDKTFLRINLGRIMNERLNGVKYEDLNQEFIETAIKMVHYTNNQPESLKTEYVKTFVEDCITAYDGSDGMTCSMGALERIFFSFVTAASVVDNNNIEWKKIINCIVENTKDLVDGYIKEWYKLHKKGSGDEFSAEMKEEEKRKNLYDFLINRLPEEGDLINDRIKEFADYIGYADDNFVYGGQRSKASQQLNQENAKRHCEKDDFGKKLSLCSATTRNRRKRKHTRKIIRQKNKNSFCVKSTNKKKI